jgi:hypothetical protein
MVTSKLSLCWTNKALHHEDVRGNGCVDPRILDLGFSWRRMVIFLPRPLYPPGKSLQYPLHRRLNRPQYRSAWRGEKKNLTHTRTRTPPLARPTCRQSLYRLRWETKYSCSNDLQLTFETFFRRGVYLTKYKRISFAFPPCDIFRAD